MSTYSKVKKWNARCGNTAPPVGTPEYYAVLQNQLARIAEEVNEAQKALSENDIQEVIDAGFDMDVVVAGYNCLAGADYDPGIKLVLGNNDLKVTKSKKKAQNWLQYQQDNGVDCYLCETVIGSQTFYCVKRTSDDKILKPGNFPKVDLSPVVPEPALMVGLLLEDSEGVLSDEHHEYIDKTGFQVLFLDKFPEEDPVREVMSRILEEAGPNGAFVFFANNHIVGAEHFTVDGPTVQGEQTDEEE